MLFILVKMHLAASSQPFINHPSDKRLVSPRNNYIHWAHGRGSWRRDTCDGHRWLVHNSRIAAYSRTYNADSSTTIFRFMNAVAHLTLHDFWFFFFFLHSMRAQSAAEDTRDRDAAVGGVALLSGSMTGRSETAGCSCDAARGKWGIWCCCDFKALPEMGPLSGRQTETTIKSMFS